MKTKFNLQMIIFTFVLIFNLMVTNVQTGLAQMFWNQDCQFIGSPTSYVAVPNSSSLNLTGSFTLEAWVRPVTLTGAKGIIAKGADRGSALKYGLRITTGRVEIATNGVQRLRSKASSVLRTFEWAHICGTYNSASNTFRIYINGVLDTSCVISGANPGSNSDSLFIGISGFSSPLTGRLDEVRIWSRELSTTEVSQYYRSSLGATGGVYSGLVLSTTFQDDESFGSDFSLVDASGNNNNGTDKGVQEIDLSDNPSNTITQNECVEVDGSDDYLAGVDSSAISPTNNITIECWVYPKVQTGCRFVYKGTVNTVDYALTLGTSLNAVINGTLITGVGGVPTINRWNHLAFTYSASNGAYNFYKEGELIASGINDLGTINNSAESLFVGGGPAGATDLNGFIDEVRISNYVKSQKEIVNYLHQSIDQANNPAIHFSKNVVYNLDGSAIDNAVNGGPRLYFRNNARFSHPATIAQQPVSPLNRFDPSFFSEGYYISSSRKRIPLSGSTGIIADTLQINFNGTITDVNLFIALNHTRSSDVDIDLIAPNGNTMDIFNQNTTISLNNNIITIFDDQADSALVSNHYVSFSNVLKASSGLNSVFAGDNAQGKWKLIINDVVSSDTGFLYAWGIQINNQTVHGKNLELSVLYQGFYDATTDLMISDTLNVTLRNAASPFAIVDSAKAVLNSLGVGLFSFNGTKVIDNTNYFIQINHRNSIETWSSTPQKFSFSELAYDFRNSNDKAFGNNIKQIDASPVRFGIYSGEVNEDGSIDLNDILDIYNAAANFAAGYLVTDVTGNNITDLNDILIAYNNSAEFVRVIKP